MEQLLKHNFPQLSYPKLLALLRGTHCELPITDLSSIMSKRAPNHFVPKGDKKQEDKNADSREGRQEEKSSNRVILQAKRRRVTPFENAAPSRNPFALFEGFENGINSIVRQENQKNVNQYNPDEKYQLLKRLNKDAVTWITQHVSKDPFCILTPIFNDYKKHLESIEQHFPPENAEHNLCASAITSSTVSPLVSIVPIETSNCFAVSSQLEFENHSINSHLIELDKMSKDPLYSVQHTTFVSVELSVAHSRPDMGYSAVVNTDLQNRRTAAVSSDSNEITNSEETHSNGLKMPLAIDTSACCSSSSIIVTNEQERVAKENDESMEPGIEINEKHVEETGPAVAVEKDAVYSKQCKLFYNDNGNYIGKGKGTLYLKPLNEKMQLLVRDDSSFGHILLNTLLNSSIPAEKIGKNNLLIVCMANPPIKAKGQCEREVASYLIRVKTEDDADELLKRIEECKSNQSRVP